MRYGRKNSNQSGAALIEFALVLPILLAFAVGVIYYGYIFMLDAALTHAAKQGAQVAVNIDPVDYSNRDEYRDAVKRQVKTSVKSSLSWLPASVRATLVAPPAITFATPDSGQPGTLVNIRVTMNISGAKVALLPQVDLPGIGPVPPLPLTLNGVAEIVL